MTCKSGECTIGYPSTAPLCPEDVVLKCDSLLMHRKTPVFAVKLMRDTEIVEFSII